MTALLVSNVALTVPPKWPELYEVEQ